MHCSLGQGARRRSTALYVPPLATVPVQTYLGRPSAPIRHREEMETVKGSDIYLSVLTSSRQCLELRGYLSIQSDNVVFLSLDKLVEHFSSHL